jgi:hypothetical protein
MHVGFNNATQGQAFTIKDGLNAIDVALRIYSERSLAIMRDVGAVA